MEKTKIKRIVEREYGRIADLGGSCCSGSSCCQVVPIKVLSKTLGYTEDELISVPEGTNLGLGCGNPVATGELKEGETVVDLGCGAGFDCFLAAQKVGINGRIIGIDMTPEMIRRAIYNAKLGGFENVEFVLGDIEDLPLPHCIADLVMSNCVINLSVDKKKVFQEIFRVLKPGGRMCVSDIVLLRELPPEIKASHIAYVGCVSGAFLKDQYLRTVKEAGFEKVEVVKEVPFSLEFLKQDPITSKALEELQCSGEDSRSSPVVSITIKGKRLSDGRQG